jgi:uncharacterized coiled-coil DUF342 family protein
MYEKIVTMELDQLGEKISNIQNELIGYNIMLDEVWQYHPANPDFLNPIKAYDELKKTISTLEKELDDLELKIKHLKSIN